MSVFYIHKKKVHLSKQNIHIHFNSLCKIIWLLMYVILPYLRHYMYISHSEGSALLLLIKYCILLMFHFFYGITEREMYVITYVSVLSMLSRI